MQKLCFIFQVFVLSATKMLHFPGFLCSVQLNMLYFPGFLCSMQLNMLQFPGFFERAAHWDRQTYPEGAPVPS